LYVLKNRNLINESLILGSLIDLLIGRLYGKYADKWSKKEEKSL